MKEIYEKKYIPSYLDDTGCRLLSAAFKYYDLLSNNENILFMFQGGKISNTLKAVLKKLKITWQDFEIGIDLNNYSYKNVFKLLHDISLSESLFMEMISKMCKEEKYLRKYDYLLPIEYLDEMYLKNNFDIEGLKEYLIIY